MAVLVVQVGRVGMGVAQRAVVVRVAVAAAGHGFVGVAVVAVAVGVRVLVVQRFVIVGVGMVFGQMD